MCPKGPSKRELFILRFSDFNPVVDLNHKLRTLGIIIPTPVSVSYGNGEPFQRGTETASIPSHDLKNYFILLTDITRCSKNVVFDVFHISNWTGPLSMIVNVENSSPLKISKYTIHYHFIYLY